MPHSLVSLRLGGLCPSQPLTAASAGSGRREWPAATPVARSEGIVSLLEAPFRALYPALGRTLFLATRWLQRVACHVRVASCPSHAASAGCPGKRAS